MRKSIKRMVKGLKNKKHRKSEDFETSESCKGDDIEDMIEQLTSCGMLSINQVKILCQKV